MNNMVNSPIDIECAALKQIDLKTPKRVLHFSDGIIEEFSEDENDIEESNAVNLTIDEVNIYLNLPNVF